ncbi:MAG: SurA N-terminal domain-containing protein [Pseudomonadota bacterium]|jgi:parvulin-like peptidyl-prolyl isomerase
MIMPLISFVLKQTVPQGQTSPTPRRTLLASSIAVLATFPVLYTPLSAAPKSQAPAPVSEFVIDAVVASVDEKPITLSELTSRLSTPRKLSLKEIATDQEAQQTLETIIFERILEAEASLKRVSVDDAEIEEYINEVAARNSLSRPDFEGVLKREGKSVAWYRRQVRSEILKTKLASSIAKGGVSVSEQEVDEYVSSNPSLSSGGASVKLRSISIAHAGRSNDEISAKVQAVEQALAAGKSFESAAQEFSDNPNRAEGGLLGMVAVKDLSGHILEAVRSLEAGKYSKPVVTEGVTQIFFVEERLGAEDDEEGEENQEDKEDDNGTESEAQLKARRDEARKTIQKRKTEEKLSSYFGAELQKNHIVDKKY